SAELLDHQEPELEPEIQPADQPEQPADQMAEQQIVAEMPANQEAVIDLGMEPAARSGFLGDIQL
ncbi:MAG: hypothetical protein NWQ25_10070, partial [Prochlorococcaceae cyanobacterium MAG_34]|nr:hypothetical protein [Prochlorococcaceae cyanobacterium MAG_34]